MKKNWNVLHQQLWHLLKAIREGSSIIPLQIKKNTPRGTRRKLLALTSFLKELNYTLQLDQLLSVASTPSSRLVSPFRRCIYPRLPSVFRFHPFISPSSSCGAFSFLLPPMFSFPIVCRAFVIVSHRCTRPTVEANRLNGISSAGNRRSFCELKRHGSNAGKLPADEINSSCGFKPLTLVRFPRIDSGSLLSIWY